MGAGKHHLHGWLGLAVFLAAGAASLAGVGWVRLWFYQIAWWSYIMAADGLIHALTGNSLLVERRRAFWFMCLASAFFWFAWEAVNLRLHNWHYVGAEPNIWLRWPGTFLAFATVLPGIFQTYELLGIAGVRWGAGVRPFPPGTAWYGPFVLVGAAMLLLPLAWPGLFFPLVWGALVFLLEPLNHRLGNKSLVAYWQRGDLSPFARLLLAGLICGAFWESWNWLAEARWRYTIPYLATPKIFAMPLAGYLGFAPFAAECYVFFAAASWLRGGAGWEADDYDRPSHPPPPAWLRLAVYAGALGFGLFMCHMIDTHLVKGWLP